MRRHGNYSNASLSKAGQQGKLSRKFESSSLVPTKPGEGYFSISSRIFIRSSFPRFRRARFTRRRFSTSVGRDKQLVTCDVGSGEESGQKSYFQTAQSSYRYEHVTELSAPRTCISGVYAFWMCSEAT